jgi:tetratricopeptide (TPR) repeat protein
MDSASTLRAFDLPVLADRLSQGSLKRGKPIVFLVGCPISCAELPSHRGVPGVEGIIDRIKAEISRTPESRRMFDEELRISAQRYQSAFELLVGFRGQDVANEIVQRAVLEAFASGSDLHELNESLLKHAEEQIEQWALPTGVRTLGKLITTYPAVFGKAVLTSNFDPLIEISIRKAGGRHFRTILHRDGDLTQTSADGCHVVHFHGYWRDHDTLHTPSQLRQARPRLESSLRQLISSCTVVVIGYGGWDDIFSKALVNVVVDDSAKPDVLWTFFDGDWQSVIAKNGPLLKQLEPGIARGRISFYTGIDCNTFFPRLLQEISNESSSAPISIAPTVTSRLVELRHGDSEQSSFELRIQLPDPFQVTTTDAPPHVVEWVGREPELDLIARSVAPLVVINGIGGQGKSSLAAKAVEISSRTAVIEGWDWRDCKEEGDRLNTQLLKIIGRLSTGQFDTAHLETLDASSLVEVLFNVLGNRKWLFVFDNVDHYVDLVSGEFLVGLEMLSRAVMHKTHRSKFIFTCRPPVRVETSQILPIRLTGLSEGESVALFAKHGVSIDQGQALKEAFELTGGHPMWVNMIAIHVARTGNALSAVVSDIRRGSGELPERTLRSIWKGLSEHQKSLLRTLAEFERSKAEDEIFEMVVSMNWNRFSKTFKLLKAWQLVVVKSRPGEREVAELHPLVKAFIRREFQPQDRERFITPIIKYLEKMIGKFKGVLDQEPSFAILEHWTQKAEVEINRGRLEDACKTLMEASKALRTRGYGEEFARIGKRILQEIVWSEAFMGFQGFANLVGTVVEVTTQLGQFEEAEGLLEKYESAIPGKSALYISLCDLRCNLYWYWQKFDRAVVWGERGEELKKSTDVDTSFSTSHNLALSRRDSGDIEPALTHFLGGRTLDEVLNKGSEDKEIGGAFYGNIGRCLHLLGRVDDALIAYGKSARILEDDTSVSGQLNRGYIRLWIGDVLRSSGKVELARMFLLAAIYRWHDIAPPRAKIAIEALRDSGATWDEDKVDRNEAIAIERVVRGWLSSSV